MPNWTVLQSVQRALGRAPDYSGVPGDLLSPHPQSQETASRLEAELRAEGPPERIFAKRLKDIGAQLITVADAEAQAKATLQYLNDAGAKRFLLSAEPEMAPLAEFISQTPDFASLVAEGTNLSHDSLELHRLMAEFPAAVMTADYGLADTGSLVLLPNPHRLKALALIPELCIFWLRRSHLLTDRASWLARYLGPARLALPSGMIFIAGGSVTADIEKVLVRPAQGPREVVVIMSTE